MEPEISLAPEILSSVERALSEDIGSGDATTDRIVPSNAALEAKMICKGPGVLAGLSLARVAFQLLDQRVNLRSRTSDGERVEAGQILAEVNGPARAILSAERTALNFVG